MLSRLAYLALCRSIQLLGLLARGDTANDLELLVHAISWPSYGGRPHVPGWTR